MNLQHGDRVCFVRDDGFPDAKDTGTIVQLQDFLTIYWDDEMPHPTEYDVVEPDGSANFDDENGTRFEYTVRVVALLDEELEARMVEFGRAHEDLGTENANCTCAGCPRERVCVYTWDAYNTGGDCLWRASNMSTSLTLMQRRVMTHTLAARAWAMQRRTIEEANWKLVCDRVRHIVKQAQPLTMRPLSGMIGEIKWYQKEQVFRVWDMLFDQDLPIRVPVSLLWLSDDEAQDQIRVWHGVANRRRTTCPSYRMLCCVCCGRLTNDAP